MEQIFPSMLRFLFLFINTSSFSINFQDLNIPKYYKIRQKKFQKILLEEFAAQIEIDFWTWKFVL